MKSLLNISSSRITAICTFLLLTSINNPAFAHGADEPQHGGQVVMSGDVTFEIVNNTNSVELYLLDDGEPMNTQGQIAKIKLKDESPARLVEMASAGTNRFLLSNFSLGTGAKILVIVTKADGYSKLGANFVIK